MVNVLASDFSSVSACLPCFLSKDCLSWNFLDIYLTTFFGVHKFKNTSAMRVIFFLKMFKIESKLPKCKKKWEKFFRSWDKIIWRCRNKLSLLRKQYLSLPVNGLTNSPKTLHINKKDSFQLNWLLMTNRYFKGAVVQISTGFRTVFHVSCRSFLSNGTF